MNKKFSITIIALSYSAILIFTLSYYNVFASSAGRTGRTLKTSTTGCSCHGTNDAMTSVVISGPALVAAGSVNTYVLTINRAFQTGAGCDIAARTGLLSPVSTSIRLSGNELTHNYNIPMTNNSVDIIFSYTAPLTATIDTIFATGNATNSNSMNSGDLWNWASNFRVEVVQPKILHLDVMMEGFYNPVPGLMIKDTAVIYLRNTSSPYDIIDSSKAFLDSLGNADFSFLNAQNETSYYIVAIHRNSLETWSAGGNSFTSNSMIYNFTLSASQAYGDNQKQVGTKWTIFGGDVNQDEIIEGSDLLLIDNDASNFATGYLLTDLNGDEIVDGTDAIIAGNNSSNFISIARP